MRSDDIALDEDHDAPSASACGSGVGNCTYGANTAFADAEWSYQGLPEAFYFCWALRTGIGGAFHTEECPENRGRALDRDGTPGEIFRDLCSSLLSLDDFDDEGLRFTGWYHPDRFREDLVELFGGAEEEDLEDGWDAFDRLASRLDERLLSWRREHPPGSGLVV